MKIISRVLPLILLATALVSCSSFSGNKSENKTMSASSINVIKASDPRIHYSGRMQYKDGAMRFDWAGVEIRFAIKGSAFTLLMDGGGSDYNIVVDGEVLQILRPDAGIQEHVIALPSSANSTSHEVVIQRRNDPHFGVTTFRGLALDTQAELLSKPALKARKIEFIGDSYTVGYGNEGASTQCDSLRPYENNALSYAALTASALEAEAHMSAVSGRGLVRNYGDKNRVSDEPMPSLYGRVLFHDENSVWDFTQWQPDAVVIKLGTNDFSTEPHPDHIVFQQALTDLINRVTQYYGDTPIFLLADNSMPVIVDLYRSYHQKNYASNSKVHYVVLPKPALEQLGCDWHPNVQYHQQAAAILAPVIKKALAWD